MHIIQKLVESQNKYIQILNASVFERNVSKLQAKVTLTILILTEDPVLYYRKSETFSQ